MGSSQLADSLRILGSPRTGNLRSPYFSPDQYCQQNKLSVKEGLTYPIPYDTSCQKAAYCTKGDDGWETTLYTCPHNQFHPDTPQPYSGDPHFNLYVCSYDKPTGGPGNRGCNWVYEDLASPKTCGQFVPPASKIQNHGWTWNFKREALKIKGEDKDACKYYTQCTRSGLTIRATYYTCPNQQYFMKNDNNGGRMECANMPEGHRCKKGNIEEDM